MANKNVNIEQNNVEKEELNQKNKALEEQINKNTETKEKNENNVKKEKAYMVYTPVQNFNGIVAGVQFAYGKAEVKEGWVLNWFKEKGYKVEELNQKNKALEEQINKNTETKEKNENNVKKEKAYMVYTPVQNFNGIVAGVQFAYGKAEVKEGWVLNWFKEKGYKVEEIK